MMNFISAMEELNFGEAMIMLVVGMIVIFITLSVLIGLLHLIRLVVNANDKPKATTVVEKSEPQINIEEDEEIVAAITAAITCIMQQETKEETIVPPFRIKKIKHIH